MEKRNALLKLLFASFLLYLALPPIREISSSLGALFWACWIGFFLLVAGANLGILFNLPRNQVSFAEEEREEKGAFLKQN